jgi:hypothetical protein
MIWIILHFIFLLIPVVVPVALFRNKGRIMTHFYLIMAMNIKARKFYIRFWLLLLLLFHYDSTFLLKDRLGIMLSTIFCIMMFSFKWSDRWMKNVHDRTRTVVILAIIALVTVGIPHLYTLSISLGLFLTASLFYPSSKVISDCQDMDNAWKLLKCPDELLKSYYNYHHA